MATFSFVNVQATLSGPGGSISLGYGAGNAKEGISIEYLEDKNMITVGADGSIMHSLRASQATRIMVRLLKTSPTNSKLSKMVNLQRASSILWGKNTLLVSDPVRGDVAAADTVAFVRHTAVTWAEDANINEWSFVGNANILLGSGE